MTTLQHPLEKLVHQQKTFFGSGQTRPLDFRMEMLRRLQKAIQQEEEAIMVALAEDFGKPPFETYATEIAILQAEIKFMLRHLPKWAKMKRVKSSFLNFPSSDAIYAEPYGVSLVIGAWNYPFQLTLSPMLGVIAAGCCAILKPSELTSATSQLTARMIQEHFPPQYLTVVQGGPEVSQALLELPFDKIFFTGSVPVGRIVAQAAAKQLIPVTLELGGKSPCLVDETADLAVTAKRIVWGKFLNAGQTCVAPDYLLVQESVAAPLLEQLAQTITEFYSTSPAQSPDFARIINERHFERLKNLLDPEKIYAGGETNAATRFISPTLLSGITWEHPIMQEEIFGPLLPVLTFKTLPEAISQVNARPKPLALYFFSQDGKAKEMVLTQTSSGGMCINDTLSHLANPFLPFGGVGTSGQGNYHGKASFLAFSHQKSILMKPARPDLPLRYPPYGEKMTWMKRAFKWF
ncbi:aldehyde dehydrogenase [Rufibacter latericius]|uniref:Aldehyde dehydrogenase n=1 Tax=Rufibacter latericius TaxID=2487040 RepID=A0A3M9ML07_9BACT|nr:aldehyde dehydrogenase [Rufibacter latericius]RNI26230.1 aldehyde dehydrogenase [Rufibacter latericius]